MTDAERFHVTADALAREINRLRRSMAGVGAVLRRSLRDLEAVHARNRPS